MEMEWMITALIIGMGGSLHCISMCGPLMFANLFEREKPVMPIWNWVAYQAGRIGTYAAWGFVFGWAGSSIKWFGLQQNISIATGAGILLALLLLKIFPGIERKVPQLAIFGALRSLFSNTIHSKTPSAKLMGGMLNGMLPCGLVYVAWAGAAASQNPLKGGVFMILFGLGTLPMLFALWLFGSRISIKTRALLNRWYPMVIGCMAMMLIIRGMNMGNFFSPALKAGNGAVVHCAEK